MKKFIIALFATAAIASPIAAQAQDRHDDRKGSAAQRGPGPAPHGPGPAARGPSGPAPHGPGPAARGPGGPAIVNRAIVGNQPNQYRRWNKGQRFDRRYAQNYQEIGNWQQYRGRRLYAPPRGYHWVRSGNDAVLVAVTGGLIGAVLAGAFQ